MTAISTALSSNRQFKKGETVNFGVVERKNVALLTTLNLQKKKCGFATFFLLTSLKFAGEHFLNWRKLNRRIQRSNPIVKCIDELNDFQIHVNTSSHYLLIFLRQGSRFTNSY